MVDTMSLPAILVGSLLGLLVCILIAAVVYTVCKRRKILTEDEEKVLPPKVYQVSVCYLFTSSDVVLRKCFRGLWTF